EKQVELACKLAVEKPHEWQLYSPFCLLSMLYSTKRQIKGNRSSYPNCQKACITTATSAAKEKNMYLLGIHLHGFIGEITQVRATTRPMNSLLIRVKMYFKEYL
ncbi:hypothetical protein ACFPQ1_29940, partial [Rhodocytophaga aerolata]|uniref:hypothetical protein n=1 Tax=Rhodocytophaga aerolata TaxID=455078 RepID=UPI0036113730